MELQVIRTIHPVGQGAFYTETLHRPGYNNDKHIVYDCGVSPYSNRLEEEIKNYLPKDSTIDIFFLSHFHADHVNGLKLLGERYKIKNIVLPQIDEYEWFYILENYLTNSNADVNIISYIRANIGEAKIIQVAPVEEGDSRNVSEEPALVEGVGPYINGLSPLIIDRQNYKLWHYIVVNPLQKGDIATLKREIQNIDYNGRKLTIGDLRNPDILIKECTKLQAAYKKVFKDGNEYSMCMLSELADRMHYSSNILYNKRIHWERECRYCERIYEHYNLDGGLYCGDADFLHCDTLSCLQKRLKGRGRNVGLLQLPHHGSKENFNIDLLNWLCRPFKLLVSFACYGSPNQYNHPSSNVMGAAGTYGEVFGVNQYKSNVLTERIDVL